MSEKMYNTLLEIIKERTTRSYDEHDHSAWIAYSSMLDMLEYAHDDNYECLVQFSY